MKIEVTKADIEWGRIGMADACPVALALTRICGGEPHKIWVGAGRIYIKRMTLPLPLKAALWIARYDHKEAVEPFEFEMPLLDELHLGRSVSSAKPQEDVTPNPAPAKSSEGKETLETGILER